MSDSLLQTKTMKVYRRLIQTQGERPLKPRREPMHELISTMLSHRTTHQVFPTPVGVNHGLANTSEKVSCSENVAHHRLY